MLPKKNRIKKKKDFDRLFKKAKSIKTKNFVLRVLPNALNENRFGFIVSQKVAKKAVVRNKTRRILSQIAEKINKEIKTSTDIVVVALAGSGQKDFQEIWSDITTALGKLKIINNV